MLLPAVTVTAYAQNYLAVINQTGEVWPRSLDSTSVGPGFMLQGPSIFGGPGNLFVLSDDADIVVITESGTVWDHYILQSGNPPTLIQGGVPNDGSLFGGPDTAFVLKANPVYYVVNTAGQVWAHIVQNGTVGNGILLNGASIFGAPNTKYVLYDPAFFRIFVINTKGQVWAHDLSCTQPGPFGCVVADTVGSGYKLAGHSILRATSKYVVVANTSILVVNTAGQVSAHKYSHAAVHAGQTLQGPGLFGGDDDRDVTVFTYHPIN
jgi:hypothetical protein